MTRTEATEILERFTDDPLLSGRQRTALRKLLDERAAVVALVGEFRACGTDCANAAEKRRKESISAPNGEGLRWYLYNSTKASTWAAAADELERTIRQLQT